MWLTYLAGQGKSGLDWAAIWTAIGTVLAALIALVGAIAVAFVTLRTSTRSEDNKREAELDDRQDAELARVTAERDRKQDEADRVRDERDRLWADRQAVLEREVIYRRWIRNQGADPNEVLANG